MEQKKLRVAAANDFSELSTGSLKRICEIERELWGYWGFEAYSYCTDIECRTSVSINETYGVNDEAEEYIPLTTLEGQGPKLIACPECGSDTELIFKPKEYLDYLKATYTKHDKGSLVLDEDNTIQGFIHIFSGNIREVIDAINIRQSYDISTINHGLPQNTNILCLSKVGLSPKFRGKGIFRPLLLRALEVNSQASSMPIITDTRYDSRLYIFLKSIGFIEIEKDSYGAVLLIYKNHKKLIDTLSLKNKRFKELFGEKLEQLSNWQDNYINGIKKHHVRKKYPGVTIT